MAMTTQSVLGVVFLLLMLAALAVWRSPELRGLFSEIKLYFLAKLWLKPPKYKSIERSKLMELLDHPTHHEIVVSPYGVFCIEYVSYCGHVESRTSEAHWYLHQGEKWYRFSNPMLRAQQRAKSLVDGLKLPTEHVHALTVFSGCSRLDNNTLPGVFSGSEFIKHVRKFKKVVLSKSRMQGLLNSLSSQSFGVTEPASSAKPERIEPPAESVQLSGRSVESVENTTDSTQTHVETKAQHPILASHSCPSCGDKMLLRKITKGNRQGMHLWGCASFPDCRTLQWLK